MGDLRRELTPWDGIAHPRYHSPHIAILAHYGWAVVLPLFGRNLETFISSLVFVVLISYALMTIALIKARDPGHLRRRP